MIILTLGYYNFEFRSDEFLRSGVTGDLYPPPPSGKNILRYYIPRLNFSIKGR